jgi:hypothetical protein
VDIPEGIHGLCEAFVDGLTAALGGKLYGVYLYGAWAFPEGTKRGDIDFHVILREALSDREKLAVSDLHTALAQAFPSLVGEALDGYYILLEEARRTTFPRHQLLDDVVDDSWALHRAHVRAGRCIVLHGPDPREIYPAASWVELANALQGELAYVEKHLTDYPAYCVLNLCRLMYSFETRDVVVSKYASARWACDAFPEKSSYIEAARKVYEASATTGEKELLGSEIDRFFEFACEHIRESRSKPQTA